MPPVRVLCLVVVAAAMAVSGCRCRGGHESASQPAPQPHPTGPSPAPALTPAQLVDRVRACDARFDARDQDGLAGCYAPAATAAMAGSQLSATGARQVVEQLAGALWAGFPDLRVQPQLILAADHHVVSVDLLAGNNRGAFLGQPATDHPIGLVAARALDLDDRGHVGNELLVVDEATLRGQLGDLTLVTRPVIPAGAAKPKVVIARGDQAERDAAALVAKADVALNDHDLAALVGLFADDAVLTDHTANQDARGKVAIQSRYQALLTAFPDLHTTRIALWAAGPWVVQRVDLIGTNDGPWPDLGIRVATHRPIRLRQLAVAEVAHGAIKTLWTFANGLSLRIQLGLVPDPTTAAPPEDEDEAPR